jgi:WD40 repeat protein
VPLCTGVERDCQRDLLGFLISPSVCLLHSLQITLERTLGHTCSSPNSLIYHPRESSEFLYCCGSVLSRYHQRTHAQRFYTGRRGHELGCIDVSEDGQLIAAGEKGKNAAVLIWEAQTAQRTALLLGHASSITQVKFSPQKDYLAVVSEEPATNSSASGASSANSGSGPSNVRSNLTLWRLSDHQAVWSHTFSENDFIGVSVSKSSSTAAAAGKDDGKDGASEDAAAPHRHGYITTIAWACDNTYLAVAGFKYLHYYYLRGSQQHSSTSLNGDPAYRQPLLTLDRQEAKLGVRDSSDWVSIACGAGALAQYTFGLSTAGMLCAFTLKEDRKKRNASVNTGESGGDLASAIGAAAAAVPKRWEIEKCQ